MQFVDEATVRVQGGTGGNGSRSFRREKYIPLGGPDGGNGGKGGDVYLIASNAINTLVDFQNIRHVTAGNGMNGMPARCTGKEGADRYAKVPIGTIVSDYDTSEVLGDLTHEGDRLLVARGGSRGLGNINFKTSTNRSPQLATPGKSGEIRHLHLELKVLADVGLLGLPNAGKSTLIRSVSKARVKVANYPFTTLVPQLGIVSLGIESTFVLADFPGIIEGASMGAGLGLQFLKHLTRTKLLLHVVDISSDQALVDIQTIRNELHSFSSQFLTKPCWLVLNKIDELSEEEQESRLATIRSHLEIDLPIYCISALNKQGLDLLCHDCMHFVATEAEEAKSS